LFYFLIFVFKFPLNPFGEVMLLAGWCEIHLAWILL